MYWNKQQLLPLCVLITADGVRKIRMAITSKRRGRSGGARVIIRAKIVEDELQLLYIYDKADYENISEVFLKDILQRMK